VSIRVVDSANWITLDNQFIKPFAVIPLGSFFAVDIFFYLGGFLLGYVFFTQLKKNNIFIYLMAMIHRLLRFYPSYITAILIWYQIFPHSGSGPFWPLM
jgi:peptidoglycan/LPS O-acetylase OafA/YrhL